MLFFNRYHSVNLFFLCLPLLFSSFAMPCSSIANISTFELENKINERFPYPVNVGFDVDDTLLFSTPSFILGKAIFSVNNDNWKKEPKFWSTVNNLLANSSRKKISMQSVIDYHLSRNDKLFFITNRPETEYEILSELISSYFKIPFYERSFILFKKHLNGKKIDKKSYIENFNIKVFYGDSDEDVGGVLFQHILAIRVMRSPNSQNTTNYHPGRFCEPILLKSDI